MIDQGNIPGGGSQPHWPAPPRPLGHMVNTMVDVLTTAGRTLLVIGRLHGFNQTFDVIDAATGETLVAEPFSTVPQHIVHPFAHQGTANLVASTFQFRSGHAANVWRLDTGTSLGQVGRSGVFTRTAPSAR